MNFLVTHHRLSLLSTVVPSPRPLPNVSTRSLSPVTPSGWAQLPRTTPRPAIPSSSRVPVRLPDEIIALTAKPLLHDGNLRDVASLILTCRALFNVIVPQLYHLVVLDDSITLETFFLRLGSWCKNRNQTGNRLVESSQRPSRSCSMSTRRYWPITRYQLYMSSIRPLEIVTEGLSAWRDRLSLEQVKELAKTFRAGRIKLHPETSHVQNRGDDWFSYSKEWMILLMDLSHPRHFRCTFVRI